MKSFFAHSKIDEQGHPLPLNSWEPLETHLEEVSDLAKSFGNQINSWLGELAAAAGLWHDLGKYSTEFQNYLKGSSNASNAHVEENFSISKVDHSTAGAQHAVEKVDGPLGHILAYVIAGHHSGLPDGRDTSASCLVERLRKQVPQWRVGETLQIEDLKKNLPQPQFKREDMDFSMAFATRMLFSCLVDADFLATERFMSSDRFERRRCEYPSLESMEQQLVAHLKQKEEMAPETNVNKHRASVRLQCKERSNLPHGFFTLHVPTGGGKTLSSLLFALSHAKHHKMRRVIYAVPFTSIIEQTADVFRQVLGESMVHAILEHHSNLDPEDQYVTAQSRLASENWDAPLIVTTNVQFFESLFANKTSRCRKLHRIARSVIILDEAQALPIAFLKPCLVVLKTLVEYYNCTVVLCSATQPALTYRAEEFQIGIKEVNLIISDAPQLHQSLKRVEVIRERNPLTIDDLASRLQGNHQSLCIVNTRAQAKELYQKLNPSPHYYHLSASMCPAHRSYVLGDSLQPEKGSIRRSLLDAEPCLVISTQLIEAGVDVDFPIVYRAMAGLDSIAQAAGRCNREGKQKVGYVHVFELADQKIPLFLRAAHQATSEVARLYPKDLLSTKSLEHFFRLYYWQSSQRWDSKQILDHFKLSNDKSLPLLFNFKTVAQEFQLIDDTQRSVIIPWDKNADHLIAQLRHAPLPPVGIQRRIQRYIVQIPNNLWSKHLEIGDIELLHARFPVLNNPSLYHPQFGLNLNDNLNPLIL